MGIRVLAVGKKHESWIEAGLDRYAKRLRKPYDITWQFLAHSSREADAARAEESQRIEAKLDDAEVVVLLDERGKMFDSVAFAAQLQRRLDTGKRVTIVIGGAYGVTEQLRQRADVVWSLSALVFPHQLVRLILVEQVYRAQEISAGRQYHHV
ncbi:23S rRNA (pseudouridine(1915)-N(3))-methyltransferase RlmH [Leucobacter sp. UCMA 4100]|uniref:23S rRNA (pseudouridine(1915)-N(3))-methyltransferase RlmH n=1 Tax=Leucobacter sp. UCMA 4100 TaxID=2810534 RepID=UPI0022EB60DC|nr:23S rRNA (pseudouridine(1915)-N(3))-methyltransferase RlmH [Leucobacter sp. UCMA 4100]MDA3147363.1 23S rRNA (pseudouridine(1915)-N(3))-methyltransferase RlmH [Leucobacter sp. UCMA 4100]